MGLLLMPLFLLSPLFTLLLVHWQFAPQAAAISQLFPVLVYVMLLLTAGLAVLMRQWHWLYSAVLLASHYYVVEMALASEQLAAIAMLLPLLITLLFLLLQLKPKPQPSTLSGVFLLLVILFAPPAMLVLPLADIVTQLSLPETFLKPVSDSVAINWGTLWWMALVATGWLSMLSYHSANGQRWGQFASWLAVMLCYPFILFEQAAGWVTLAAGLSLLLSLTSQMLHLAYIDELTQLPQRRALLNHLSRLGKRSAVTMLDVDHFKKFNDTYGHDVGDQVLKLLGSILANQSGLTAYRYGGEEFTLVFHHNNQQKLAEKLEQVREAVAEYPLVIRQQQRPTDSKDGKQQRGSAAANKTVHVTISLGCALRNSGESTEQLLKRADEALYKAKKAGRNKVAFAS
ncbi:GGDEF domain-containing protein [Rheinheimera sp. UJ51]|uniref:GGDEF domain-containing protein n=1 Tax=Rheinheimera sp. UJ51 TaxID=2892446 RepID=UPI001E2841F2|nr:GGDEF domain-containing protein [Rheinheimera sp. UJ51]MCC5452231.1 GGDEF domain-containing protein [Rheinheimera sp. UJ51]